MSSPSASTSRLSPSRRVADEEVDELDASSEDELARPLSDADAEPAGPSRSPISAKHLKPPTPSRSKNGGRAAKRAKHTHAPSTGEGTNAQHLRSSPPLASPLDALSDAEAAVPEEEEEQDEPGGRRWPCEWLDCEDDFGRQGKLVDHLVKGAYGGPSLSTRHQAVSCCFSWQRLHWHQFIRLSGARSSCFTLLYINLSLCAVPR